MHTKCPICGNANHCEINGPEKSCWCTTVAFPAEVFKKIPEAHLGKTCVCMDCAKKTGKDSTL